METTTVWELCEKLRTERLLVSSELETLQSLNLHVEEKFRSLALLCWRNLHHQVTVRRLIASHALITPENASTVVKKIDDVQPVEAYRCLGHHHQAVQRILILLRDHPQAVSELLQRADSIADGCSDDVVSAIFSFVYGSGAFPTDEHLILQVLRHLMKTQFVHAADPRLLLRRGHTSFARLYKLYSDTLYSIKIFLTSALHSAVMSVLSEDDIFLDVDPGKSPLRYPTAERNRRFGDDPSSPLYNKRFALHRKIILERLLCLADKFVQGISTAMTNFPASLGLLVQELYRSLIDVRQITADEARLICTDLVVTNLICPAITNPDTLGIISDTPVNHVARFNLMQMGQIVQTLTIHRLEATSSHFQPFIAQFGTNPVCSLVETIISQKTPNVMNIFPTMVAETIGSNELFHRKHFLGSLEELNAILRVIRSDAVRGITEETIRSELESRCSRLPASFPPSQSPPPHSSNNGSSHSSRSSRLRNFADKVQNSLQSEKQNPTRTQSPQRPPPPNEFLVPLENFDVIYMTIESQEDPIGLVPEEKYIRNIHNSDKRPRGQKRARFLENGSIVGSAVSDRTTDNASDLEEEAAAQAEVGSVSSSQEAPLEDRMLLLDEDNESTLPDNLSDGVSGRGTPSLSGRDTPLSQHPEAFEADAASSTVPGGVLLEVNQRELPPVPETVRKQNPEGLEEIFGKFTVPTTNEKNRRDDQRSLLSDCWSTNVAASDDEGSVAAPRLPSSQPHLTLPESEQARSGRPVNRTGSLGGVTGPEDRSDTWSVDAIASDSEADGRREKDVREQDEVSDLASVPDASAIPPLIDISASGSDLRMRRQSSGSSFSRSEADSEHREVVDCAVNPLANKTANEETVAGTPKTAVVERPETSSSKARLLQGLQRVGDKVRKGIATTPLRQIPQSSTISDLLNFNDVDRIKSTSRLTESHSENRLSELDTKTAEDILAKYQRPVPPNRRDGSLSPPLEHAPVLPTLVPAPSLSYYSSDDVENCRAFVDTKRKLRLVLSSVGSLPMVQLDSSGRSTEKEQLFLLLNTLLAESLHSRQQTLSAQVREVIRCLGIFDIKGIRKLLRSVREEHLQRSSYVQYLQMSRLTLLRLISYVERLATRVEREKTLTVESLSDVLIRFYLENKDMQLRRLQHDFVHLHALDEKIECLSRSLAALYTRFPSAPMWKDAPEPMITYVRKGFERIAMAQVFIHAFFPNGDADRHRDEVFSKALTRLAKTVSPDHPMLHIPEELRGEAPWPSARAELDIINAYKSARDKLACIVRCCETVGNLITMSSGKSAAADDITPVLVYVVIQANPHSLLSNVQFVQSFCANQLEGAEGYWWTQFVAAVEFIKTLL